METELGAESGRFVDECSRGFSECFSSFESALRWPWSAKRLGGWGWRRKAKSREKHSSSQKAIVVRIYIPYTSIVKTEVKKNKRSKMSSVNGIT